MGDFDVDQSTLVTALKDHESQKNQQMAGILVLCVVGGIIWWIASSLMTSPEEREYRACVQNGYRMGVLDDAMRQQVQARCERIHLS